MPLQPQLVAVYNYQQLTAVSISMQSRLELVSSNRPRHPKMYSSKFLGIKVLELYFPISFFFPGKLPAAMQRASSQNPLNLFLFLASLFASIWSSKILEKQLNLLGGGGSCDIQISPETNVLEDSIRRRRRRRRKIWIETGRSRRSRHLSPARLFFYTYCPHCPRRSSARKKLEY